MVLAPSSGIGGNLSKVQSTSGAGRLEAFLANSLRALGHGGKNFQVDPLAGDGSTRRFRRVRVPEEGISYVVMENEPREEKFDRENRAYLHIGKHLLSAGVPLPEIYNWDLAAGFFIMRDLGNRNLQDAGREGDRLLLYKRAIEVLLRMQVKGSEGFDVGWTCQTTRYDRSVMGPLEADYFKQAFLSLYLGLRSDWPELQISFDFIAGEASRAPNHFFLHRDFQSRNIMVQGGEIGVIDWQGGRLGPLGYDLASLIIDPYSDLSASEREAVYRSYVELLSNQNPSWVNSFEETFPFLALQRNLQILGAFSFLSKAAGKTYFEAYIPKSLVSLQTRLEKVGGKEIKPLRDLVASIRERSNFSSLRP